MEHVVLTAAQKALKINLNHNIYGTFAEIGAGQETVRHFFRAGGASGTIAKAMSAYDKEFSDAIYGVEEDHRYVTERRLRKMLDHEYTLIEERLTRSIAPDRCYFSFANTVASINFKKTQKGHGWIGIRFQTSPEKAPNEIIIHVRLHENEAKHQQETVGAIGVNLIYGAMFYHTDVKRLLLSLYEEVERSSIEVDLVNFSGPDFEEVDNRLISLQLIKNGFTEAVIFGPEGNNLLPAEILYKKNILTMRGSFRPVTKVNIDMIQKGFRQFQESKRVNPDKLVVLFELTLNNLLSDGEIDEQDFLDRADILCSIGQTVLISNFQEYYKLIDYLAQYSTMRSGLILGLPNLREIFEEKYYRNLTGGILEAFGRLFSKDMVVFVYPMLSDDGTVLGCSEADVHPRFRPIYEYLLHNKRIRDLEGADEKLLHIFSREVLHKIRNGLPGWEECLPTYVDNIIKEKRLFGYTPELSAAK